MTFIELDDNKINFKIEGKGTPVLLIHGFSDNLNYWNYIAENLKRYFTVIRIDLRGHGKTPIGNKKINNHQLGKDITALLEKLYIEKCHIIGYSLGGSIALDIAINNPKLVKSLTLLSTFAKADENTLNIFKKLDKALKTSYDTFFEMIIPYVLPKDYTTVKKVNEPKNIEDLRKILKGARKFDELENLKRINCKTLVMAGREDNIVYPKNSEEICKRINRSELVLYDDVKHDLLIKENREKVLNKILEFLRN